MRLLVDMDGVIADFEKGFFDAWTAKYPNKMRIPLEQRITFHVEEQYPAELKPLARAVYEQKGFFASLAPISGGLDALNELAIHNEVFICTSPISTYQHCVPEKYEWVEKHLGKDWVKKIIVTKDKTVVRGNFLIDDRPKIDGLDNPSWEHILYDQPYNRSVHNKCRLTWDKYKDVLGEVNKND